MKSVRKCLIKYHCRSVPKHWIRLTRSILWIIEKEEISLGSVGISLEDIQQQSEIFQWVNINEEDQILVRISLDFISNEGIHIETALRSIMEVKNSSLPTWSDYSNLNAAFMVSLACALNSVTLVKDILEKVPHIDLAQSVGLLH